MVSSRPPDGAGCRESARRAARRQADRHLPDAGNRNADRAHGEAEGHAETDGDVAELPQCLLSSRRSIFSDSRKSRTVPEKPDTIAELEDEIGIRQDIGVATAHVQNADILAPGHLKIGKRSADDGRARGEHAHVVDIATVLNEAPARCFADRLLWQEQGPPPMVPDDEKAHRPPRSRSLRAQAGSVAPGVARRSVCPPATRPCFPQGSYRRTPGYGPQSRESQRRRMQAPRTSVSR